MRRACASVYSYSNTPTNGHTDAVAHGNSNARAYPYAHPDLDSHSCSYANRYGDTDSFSYSNANAGASTWDHPDSSTQGIYVREWRGADRFVVRWRAHLGGELSRSHGQQARP